MLDQRGQLVSGNIVVNVVEGTVFAHGEEVPLQPKQLQLLIYLVWNRGRPIKRAELQRRVFRTTQQHDSSSVRRQILELRRRLGCAGERIETTPEGYILQNDEFAGTSIDRGRPPSAGRHASGGPDDDKGR
ncbi:MAG: winged helix-turn-helix domain-containing protein [Myxococcales bacterium]|nr:winged helix-turn-helix domain-containing protein [Myxococcales bacterium]